MIDFVIKLFVSPTRVPTIFTLVALLLFTTGTLGLLFCIVLLLSGEGVGVMGELMVSGWRAWFIIAMSSFVSALAGYLILVEVVWSRHFLLLGHLFLFVLVSILAPESAVFSVPEVLPDALWFVAIVWLFYGTGSASRYYATLRAHESSTQRVRDSAF